MRMIPQFSVHVLMQVTNSHTQYKPNHINYGMRLNCDECMNLKVNQGSCVNMLQHTWDLFSQTVWIIIEK